MCFCTILEVRRTTYLKFKLIQQFEPIEPRYRLLGAISVLQSNGNQFQIQAYHCTWDDKGSILEWNGQPHRSLHTATCDYSRVSVLRNFQQWKFLETPYNIHTYETMLAKGVHLVLGPHPKVAEIRRIEAKLVRLLVGISHTRFGDNTY